MIWDAIVHYGVTVMQLFHKASRLNVILARGFANMHWYISAYAIER